ncbi:SET [Glarea lozoyensis ATCC 20868]|uniref:SET n=1 Tax=Glarea lozoyensis (strain ATCC 20868 / MF5171) TaxID=1116229 RepID=S3DFY9_GLAL2|nr:SET [Glarea lozoyensis ATCC 20868]EPE36655.1 SET [Glarea lozoyensis ATCC 20868]
MEAFKQFTDWALARGVTLDGISTHKFPGKGFGFTADKTLEIGEIVLFAPVSILRTAHTVPKSISKRIGKISVNGLLAAELAMDTSGFYAPWRGALPTKQEIEDSIPFMWHPSLQELLPSASLSLLEKQKEKLSSDWAAVSAAFSALSYEVYVYHWFIVGTRTFYYTSQKLTNINHDDCLALIPLADVFNHADVGCEVTFSPSGYHIRTDRRIEKGEEICISYGNHSNDFLLAEYGFILVENKWDEIVLDEIILPLFSEEQLRELNEARFCGKFALSKDVVCYRTQVAVRLLCMPVKRWRHLVANGLGDDEDEYQANVDRILMDALNPLLNVACEKIKQVDALHCGLKSQKEILRTRWKQIHLLLTTFMSKLESNT